MEAISKQLKFKIDPSEPLVIKDKDGNVVYLENSDDFWYRSEYVDGNEVYYENSNGFWYKQEYVDGNEVYCEDSDGYVWDDRQKETVLTMDEIAKKFGVSVKDLKVVKEL
jgi:hypothetical protein